LTRNNTHRFLTREKIAAWEMSIVRCGYTQRTGRAARTVLATILGDAIPRHLQVNPAVRRRGKGRRGIRRIERNERAEKAWATPLQALLVAERCAALSGCDTDFVMVVAIAYTAMRWSEAIGLGPDCVHDELIDINWKLYELNGKFYKGRPKEGSIRPADLPPFLSQLIASHIGNAASSSRATSAMPPACHAHAPTVHRRGAPGGLRVPRPGPGTLSPLEL
jgi:hypothetical protein